MAARKWTSEQRANQSMLIQQWRPWERCTGARTPERKAAAARNAYKGGVRTMLRELSAILRNI
jgi:hypothetical protein